MKGRIINDSYLQISSREYTWLIPFIPYWVIKPFKLNTVNKNLPTKLIAKAEIVQQIVQDNKTASPTRLGELSFKAIKGYHGKTINPFSKHTFQYGEFRTGFMSARLLTKPKKVVVVQDMLTPQEEEH